MERPDSFEQLKETVLQGCSRGEQRETFYSEVKVKFIEVQPFCKEAKYLRESKSCEELAHAEKSA